LDRFEESMSYLILAPAVLVALALCGMEAYRAIRPDAALFAAPPVESLADAILHGSVEQAHAFIRDGRDPNAAITVQDPEIAGGGAVTVTPLVLAVAAGQANAVHMLLGAGARMDLPENVLAICLAEETGDEEILEALRPPPGAPPLTCPERVLGP
jgi:hypothetical protein